MSSAMWLTRGLVVCCALAWASCGGRAVWATDAARAPDAAVADAAPAGDAPPAHKDTTAVVPDAAPTDADSTPDRWPVPPSDADPPPGLTVKYLRSAGASGLEMIRVKIDGSGRQRVAGVPAPLPLTTISLVGRREEIAAVSRHIPMPLLHVSSSHRPLALPGNLGQLYAYTASSKTGYLTVRPDGKTLVLETKGGTTSGCQPSVAINRAGTMLAAVSCSTDSVHLMRTDSTKFTNGKTVCPVQLPSSIKNWYLRPQSLALANKNLFFINSNQLLRVPLDCPAVAATVKLPLSFRLSGYQEDQHPVLSEDGTHVAMLGNGVIVVKDATGKATLVGNTPGTYYSPGHLLMYYDPTTTTHIDLSPQAKMLAWVMDENGGDELYVRPVNRSKVALRVTDNIRLHPKFDVVVSVQWLNDDDLLFWAGPSVGHLDLLHFRISTGKLVNLTGTVGSSQPPLHPEGGWFGRKGKQLYYLEYSGELWGTGQCNLRVIDRAKATVKDITKNLYIYYGGANIEAAADSGRVFFFARSAGSATRQQDLYYFNQDTVSTAVQLTKFPAYTRIYSIQPSRDGAQVTFGAGLSEAQQQLYAVQVKSTPVVHKLTSSAGYLSEMKWFTPKGGHLVYAHGSALDKLSLRVQSTSGGSARVLDPLPARISPVMVW